MEAKSTLTYFKPKLKSSLEFFFYQTNCLKGEGALPNMVLLKKRSENKYSPRLKLHEAVITFFNPNRL